MDRKKLVLSLALFFTFCLFTLLVGTADICSVGPAGMTVGFATLNRAFFDLVGVHPAWDIVTDCVELTGVAVMAIFAAVGAVQWIRRKNITRVDRGILLLGGIYLALALVYGFFETVVINCRPVLSDGIAEASYPSSHVLLVATVMGTAVLRIRRSLAARRLSRVLTVAATVAVCLVSVGRLLSGRHWATDILASLLLSASLTAFYAACTGKDQ